MTHHLKLTHIALSFKTYFKEYLLMACKRIALKINQRGIIPKIFVAGEGGGIFRMVS